MNKKLVAVAIAGLLAVPLAQAQTANVTLYGRVNLDMEVVNGKQANGRHVRDQDRPGCELLQESPPESPMPRNVEGRLPARAPGERQSGSRTGEVR